MRATPTSNAAISAPRGSEPGAYDGVAELWWDSLEDLMAAYASEEGQVAGAELLEDERRFIELPSSPLWLGEENIVIGLSSSPPALRGRELRSSRTAQLCSGAS